MVKMNKLMDNPAWYGTANWDGIVVFLFVLMCCLWLMEKIDE